MITTKWDRRFMELARHVGQWSKDPSTKVGCVLVHPELRRVVSLGYNGFPAGHSDNPALYADREYKYRHVVHAEENALKFISFRARGLTAYTSFPCCPNCLRSLAKSGVSRVVQPSLDITNRPPEWVEGWMKQLEESVVVAQKYLMKLETVDAL